jgi:hypothetical protein
MRFSVELEGVESAVENLDARIDALQNLQEFFDDEGAEIIRKHQVEVMMTAGHGKWPALAESTLKKGKRRSSSPFDTDSRRMWKDLTSKGAPHHIHESTKTTLEEGTDNPVAHWHTKRRTRSTKRWVSAEREITGGGLTWSGRVTLRRAGQWVLPKRNPIYWAEDLVGRFTAAIMAFLSGRERRKGYVRRGVGRYKELP